MYVVKKEHYVRYNNDAELDDGDASQDWNPFDFQEEEDEPLIEDPIENVPVFATSSVKIEKTEKHVPKKAPAKKRKNRKMDSAIEDAIARMHAANRKRNVASAGHDIKTKLSRTIRIVRSAEGELTWAELRLKRAYDLADSQKKKELDKAGRSCLLNAQKLPQMLKDNVHQNKTATTLGKRKQEMGTESNAYEETARKRRAIEVFGQRKKKKDTEYIVGVALTKIETKKPLKPKHKIIAEEKSKPLETERKNNFDFDEDVPSADMMMYATAEESKDGGLTGLNLPEREDADKYEPTDPNWSRVHVAGLETGATWRQLKKAFVHCGRVKLCQVVQGRGFGFITFSNQQEARNAMEDMNGRLFQGKPITVTWARDRQNQPRRHHRKRHFKRDFNRGKAPTFVRSKKQGGAQGRTNIPTSYRPLHDGGNALNRFKPLSPTHGGINALPSTYRPLSPKHSLEPVEQKQVDFYGFDD